MANDTMQAAGAVTAAASGVLDGARTTLWRTLAVVAFALALLLSLTAVTLEWDGLATAEADTPGAPSNAADAEQ